MIVPISNRPWSDVPESAYDVAQWHRACLIHLHDGAPQSKAECKLPVREPSGTLNRNGVHAAAAALAGARGGVNAPAEQRRNAARRLRSLYRELDEDPPDSVARAASG